MELEINGNKYQTGKLSPFEQFHLSRKLVPVFFALGTSMSQVSKAPSFDDPDTLLAFGPLVEAIAKMSTEDSEYVLNTCLDTCTRQQAGGGWQRLRVSGRFLFDDIDMQIMMRLVVEVVKENLSNFIPGALE